MFPVHKWLGKNNNFLTILIQITKIHVCIQTWIFVIILNSI